MADNPSDPTGPLDVQRIHYFVRLMKRYDLTALDISDGQIKIRLRRRGSEISSPPLASHPLATVAAVSQHANSPLQAPPRPEQPSTDAPSSTNLVVIKSPMVGTFYASSAPDAPPFVSPGSRVHSETIVCIIEAMKVFTDIPAGVSGTITEVLVKNGQAVEYSQPLFQVIPA
jgi:acetyl-CoA carboxylase biotin carboxyl carrier protein